MPYISKHERARGAWVDATIGVAYRGRCFDPGRDFGPRCSVCGLPMVAAVVASDGRSEHPTCTPKVEWD